MDYSQLCTLSESKWPVTSLSIPLYVHVDSLQPAPVDLNSWFNVGSNKKYSRNIDVSYNYAFLLIVLTTFDTFT